MKTLALILGILLLFAFEIMRVYFIMPFPGSQEGDTVAFAYFLNNNLIYIRLLLLFIIAYPTVMVLTRSKWWKRVLLLMVLGLYGMVFYMFNYKFLADKMFYQPHHKNFVKDGVANDQIIIGVALNGDAHAYPIEILAYHHQIQDTIGGEPVMVTYCSVCRTASVFSPIINGKHETFRLVGMDHFNAMFEDATTKSWWRQVTGECIAGPLKGTKLKQLPSEQMTLRAWQRQYPYTPILIPDPDFAKRYAGLEGYARGIMRGGLEGTDTASWQPKSWVVGVTYNGASKAYDWNLLIKQQVIEDSLNGLPVLLVVDRDSASFHVLDRRINGQVLNFKSQEDDLLDITKNDSLCHSISIYLELKDINTGSIWRTNGNCECGKLKGKHLDKVQASQEFWHSWKTFHPNTLQYK